MTRGRRFALGIALEGFAALMAGGARAQAPVAADYLAGFIHNRLLACDLKPSPSTPGKAYALCNVGGQDFSAAMAEAGMAWSYTPRTKDYTVQESNAMIGVFGVHAHDCMKAWEWRTRQLPPR